MRQAYKVAYLGSGFHGSQRQPGLRTVEGELLEGLRREGVLDDPREARFQMASRTDRGVSALGNVVAFDSSWDPREVVVAVNRHLENVWLHAYAEPGDAFRPRWARERWYRYHYPRPLDPGRLEAAARPLLGTHDFQGFVRGEGGLCTIRSIRGTEREGWTLLDIRADRFHWQMVRRIAGALEACCEGEGTEESLSHALEGREIPAPPSPARYLVLVDVRYDFPFRPFLHPASPALREAERLRHLETSLLGDLLGASGLQD